MSQFRLGVTLLIAGGALFIASAYFMALRIDAYYKATPPPGFLFTGVIKRDFNAFGIPASLTDSTDASGNHVLRVRFGSSEKLIPVRPPAVGRPDLAAYEERLAVLGFAPLEKGRVLAPVAKADSPPGGDARLVVVWRNFAPGETEGIGSAPDRNRWTFGLLEFNRDGTLSERLLQFPLKRGTAQDAAGKPQLAFISPEVSARVEPIAQRSWEWQAVLFTIPKLQISNYRFNTDATGAMGWTLPAAGFSALALVAGILLCAIGARVTPTAGAANAGPASAPPTPA